MAFSVCDLNACLLSSVPLAASALLLLSHMVSCIYLARRNAAASIFHPQRRVIVPLVHNDEDN